MEKRLVWLGLFVGSAAGSWLGALIDHGNWLGGWSIAGGTVGSLIGIWAGYKLGKNL